jgi:hypothetical protein
MRRALKQQDAERTTHDVRVPTTLHGLAAHLMDGTKDSIRKTSGQHSHAPCSGSEAGQHGEGLGLPRSSIHNRG